MATIKTQLLSLSVKPAVQKAKGSNCCVANNLGQGTDINQCSVLVEHKSIRHERNRD